MTRNELKKELGRFISSSYRPGALLITGKWGSGKTYFLKEEWAREVENPSEPEENPYIIIFVSLFDVASVNDAHRKIKQEIAFRSGIKAQLADISSMVQTNTVDYIHIAKEIPCICDSDEAGQYTYKSKRLVLVFDDFERCSIEMEQRCGLINEFVEKYDIPTIIVTNEDQMDDKATYELAKEKIVIQTVFFNNSIEQVFDDVISILYKKVDDDGYINFINSHKETLTSAFNQSGYMNIRSFQSIIYGFRRFFDVCMDLNIESSDLTRLLYSFSVITYEYKAGNYIRMGAYNTYILSTSEPITQEKKDQHNEKRKEIEEKYAANAFTVVNVVPRFIVNGKWSEEDAREAFKKAYLKITLDRTPFQRLTMYTFRNLDQEAIEQGYPEALKKAYEGELNCNELQKFLSNVYLLEKNGYQDFKEPINYRIVEAALKKRLLEKELVDDNDGVVLSYSEDSFSPEAKRIYELIQKAPYFATWRKSQAIFWKFVLDDKRTDFRSQLPQRILEFSCELAKDFFSAYQKGDSIRIQALTDALNSMDFYNIEVSISGLTLLSNLLTEHNDSETDFIKSLLTKDFIESLKEKIKAYKKKAVNNNGHDENGNT